MFRYCLSPPWGTAVILWGTLALSVMTSRTLPAQSETPSLELLQRQLQEQARRIDELEAAAQVTPPAADVSEEIRGLSDRMSSLEAGAETLRELESSFLESPSTESLQTTTGRLHLDYWSFPNDSAGVKLMETGDPSTPPEDRFELRRIRIGVRGAVPPKNVTYQLDLEFSGIEQIGIRDAWIGFEDHPIWEAIRIGNQKRPYALDQLNSSNFMVFLERPMIIEAVNDPNRRLGIQSFGLSDSRTVNWRLGVFNLVPIEESGVISDNDYQLEFAGRLASTPYYDEASGGETYVHAGLAASFAFPSDDANISTARFRTRPEARTASRWLDTGVIAGSRSYQLLATETVFNVGPVQLGGEYINVWLQRESPTGADLHLHGGYLYFSYFLTGEHLPWNRDLGILGRVEPFADFICTDCRRHQGWGAWQFAARLSVADLNDADTFGGRGLSLTLALNWYWNSHTRLQFNYILGEIDDRQVENNAGNNEIVSGSYEIFGTRLMIDY